MATTGQKILTSQKRLVIEAVNEMTGPFTAQDVCERMAKMRSRASRATIYRMLTELTQEELIREFWLPSNRRVCVRSDQPLVCVIECADCGKIEFPDAKRVRIEMGLTDTSDVQTTIHRKVRCPRLHARGSCAGTKPNATPPGYRKAVKDASRNS